MSRIKIKIEQEDGTSLTLSVADHKAPGMRERILNFLYVNDDYPAPPPHPPFLHGQYLPTGQHVKGPAQTAQEFIRGEKRLPNTSVIDPKELDLQQARKKEILIRCPDCGQSHAAIIAKNASMGVMLSRHGNSLSPVEGTINMELQKIMYGYTFSAFLEKTKMVNKDKLTKEQLTGLKNQYYIELNSIATDPSFDVDAENSTQILCPVCGKQNELWKWLDAYINPLNYFETDNPCIACGGEVSYIPEADNGAGRYQCDKCGCFNPAPVHVSAPVKGSNMTQFKSMAKEKKGGK